MVVVAQRIQPGGSGFTVAKVISAPMRGPSMGRQDVYIITWIAHLATKARYAQLRRQAICLASPTFVLIHKNPSRTCLRNLIFKIEKNGWHHLRKGR